MENDKKRPVDESEEIQLTLHPVKLEPGEENKTEVPPNKDPGKAEAENAVPPEAWKNQKEAYSEAWENNKNQLSEDD